MNAAKSSLIRRHSELHCRQKAAKLPLTASSSVRQSEERPQLAGVGSEGSEILANSTPFRAPLSTESCKTAPDSLLFSPLERRAPSACRCWLRRQRNPSSFDAIPSSIVHIELQNCPWQPPLQSARAKSALSLRVLAPKAAKSWLIRRHYEFHCPQRAAKLPQTASSSVRQSEECPQLAGVGSERSEIPADSLPFLAPLSSESCKTAPDCLLFSPPERRAPSACRCWLRTQRNPSSFDAIPSSIVHKDQQNQPSRPPLQSARAKSALSLQVLAPNAAKSQLILCHSELHCPQRAAKLPQTASSSVHESEERPQLAGVGSEHSEILAHSLPFRAPLSSESCKTAPDSLLFSPPERRAPSACRCWLLR